MLLLEYCCSVDYSIPWACVYGALYVCLVVFFGGYFLARFIFIAARCVKVQTHIWCAIFRRDIREPRFTDF